MVEGGLSALLRSRLICPGHPLSLLGRILPKRPQHFTIGEAVLFADLIDSGEEATEMARRLMRRAVRGCS
jgi:hypothetical protein